MTRTNASQRVAADEAPRIARRPPEARSLDYHALRKEGIALCERYSGKVWTDYNAHDPGVTLLESLCFALTELPFLAQSDVADHLCESSGQVDLARFGLQGPIEALTNRPLTNDDYRRLLLDRVELVNEIGIRSLEQPWAGLLELTFDSESTEPEVEGVIVQSLCQAYWACRNLGEDLAGVPQPERQRLCSLEGEFVLSGARDSAEILEECFVVVRDVLASRPARSLLALRVREAEARGESLADCLDGPRLVHGWISSDELNRGDGAVVFFADLARRLREVEGIAAVHKLVLRSDGLAPTVSSLPLNSREGRLQLLWPSEPKHLEGIRLWRRSVEVVVPKDSLLSRLADLRAGRRRPTNSVVPTVSGAPQATNLLDRLPMGQPLSRESYYAAFNHLPPLFQAQLMGASKGELSPDCERLVGYLGLLEQPLANALAQSQFLRDFYSLDAESKASYAWPPLDFEQLPGIEEIYLEPKAKIQQALLAEIDDGLERRSRVLDYLLALHGECFSPNSLVRFGWYFDPEQWNAYLVELKCQYLRAIFELTSERAGAVDYSQPSFDNRANTAACQTRISLLLGFRDGFCRSLSMAWTALGLRAGQGARYAERSDSIPGSARDPPVTFVRSEQGLPDGLEWLSLHVPLMRQPEIPLPFLRCAVHHERYKLVDRPEGCELWLGPDEAGSFWRVTDTARLAAGYVGGTASAPGLQQVIERLRSFACRLMFESEGMFLIEHILLRPTETLAAPPKDVPLDFFAHRVTAVFPGWTTRGHDAGFRRFVERCVEGNSPAHLLVNVLWLDLEPLQQLEDAWRAWLEAKQQACNQLTEHESRRAVDEASAALRQLLLQESCEADGPTSERWRQGSIR